MIREGVMKTVRAVLPLAFAFLSSVSPASARDDEPVEAPLVLGVVALHAVDDPVQGLARVARERRGSAGDRVWELEA